MTTPDEGPRVRIYPHGIGYLLVVFVAGLTFIGGGLVVFLGSPIDSMAHWVFAILFGGVCVLFGAAGVAAALYMLVFRKPVLGLDANGIACAKGCASWDDVERVFEVVRTFDSKTSSSLVFLLREGSSPSPAPAGAYAGGIKRIREWLERRSSFGLPPMLSSVLEVGIWGCRDKALATLRTFYADPVQQVTFKELWEGSV